MADPARLASLDLRAIVAPFADLGDALDVRIEDELGRCLAATPRRPDRDPSATADAVRVAIVLGERRAGTIVLGGSLAETPLASAAATAVAEAIGAALTAGGMSTERRIGTADAATIEAELAHGRRLQRSFVSLVPPEVPGYDLATQYEAAREIGGDFFDLFRLRRRGHPLSLVIADVTGKGIAAALLMAFSRPILHAAIDHAPGPANALERMNQVLVAERHSTLFVTALVARLELPTGLLRFANAGHEPPLFVPGDGGPISLLSGAGPLIGAFDRLDLPELETVLRPGDAILFYTDGVTDAQARDGRRFDEAGLLAALEQARGGTARDIVDEVGDAVATFTAGAEPADDLTMVAVSRQTDPGRAGRRVRTAVAG